MLALVINILWFGLMAQNTGYHEDFGSGSIPAESDISVAYTSAIVNSDELNLQITQGAGNYSRINISDNNAGYKVYPNPAIDYLVVTSAKKAIKEITITGLSGKVLKHQKYLGSKHKTTIDLRHLKNGFYILQVTGDENNLKIPFIKE